MVNRAIMKSLSRARSLPLAACSLALLLGSGSAHADGEALPPAPIHPDTLPTLMESWSLPASMAPEVTNVYAPRMMVRDPQLYVYDHNGRRLVAIDPDTGKVRWHRPVASRSDVAFALTPLVYKRSIYLASDGFFHCYDIKTGKQRWQVSTRGVGVNGIARSKHLLFLPFVRVEKGEGLPGVQIWAIEARRGKVRWTRKFEGAIGYVEGNADGAYYVADTGLVLGLTPDRGEVRWKLRVKGRVSRPPILKKDKLYIITDRHRAGWQGAGIYVVDSKTGKLLWKNKLTADRVARFMYRNQLVMVSDLGKLVVFDDKGKIDTELTLNFGDQPESLIGTVSGTRLYIFSYHPDGHGYVSLIDMKKKRVLARANALDAPVRSVIPWGKTIFLDGVDGSLHAFRLDRSARPKRRTVPEEEFATQLIAQANAEAKKPQPGLARKLAGLGTKALGPMDGGLTSSNAYVVAATAQAVSLLANRKSVPALISALSAQKQSPPLPLIDPVLPVAEALARIRDGRAVKVLTELLEDESQSHFRRMEAYVALGAIGTPAALAPLWRYRAAKALNTMTWQPLAATVSPAYFVEQDIDPTKPDAALAKATRLTAQARGKLTKVAGPNTGQKDERIFTATLSPYLGGYNDVWIGESDLQGNITRAYFTGLTKAEIQPNRRIKLDKMAIKMVEEAPPKKKDKKGAKGKGKAEAKKEAPKPAVDAAEPVVVTPEMLLAKTRASLIIRMPVGKNKWVRSKPVQIPMGVVLADRDKDGLPDIVERRLQTCVTNADCDGDGIKDSEDVNPLASGKLQLTPEQKVFREAFFAYFSFLKRRGLIVLDPGDGPSYEVYGRQDPVLSLRRSTVERLRKEVGLHAIDYVSFGGPYPEGGGSGDALKKVEWGKKGKTARIGMDLVRSGDNAAGYNVWLKKVGRNWVVTRMARIWTTNKPSAAVVKQATLSVATVPPPVTKLVKKPAKK